MCLQLQSPRHQPSWQVLPFPDTPTDALYIQATRLHTVTIAGQNNKGITIRTTRSQHHDKIYLLRFCITTVSFSGSSTADKTPFKTSYHTSSTLITASCIEANSKFYSNLYLEDGSQPAYPMPYVLAVTTQA